MMHMVPLVEIVKRVSKQFILGFGVARPKSHVLPQKADLSSDIDSEYE